MMNSCVGSLLIVCSLLGIAQGQRWDVTRITNNEVFEKSGAISGSSVVWSATDGNDNEIFLFDDGVIQQLTDNDADDRWPDISDTHVAWVREYSNERSDIIVDGHVVMANVIHGSPRVDGDLVAWSAAELDVSWVPPDFLESVPIDLLAVGENHIYAYDGSVTTQLSFPGTRSNHNPAISGGRVVWSGLNGGRRLTYLFDGEKTVELPDAGHSQVPVISGELIGGSGQDTITGEFGILLYDGEVNFIGATGSHLRIAGEQIAWIGGGQSVLEPPDREIFVYEDNEIRQLSYSSGSARGLVVTESVIAWSQDNGVHVYDGQGITQITSYRGDSVWGGDGSSILFEGFPIIETAPLGVGVSELYVARLVPEPSMTGFLPCLIAILLVMQRKRDRP